MNGYLERKKNRIRVWAERSAQKPNSRWWLAALSFAESSFFPIPPDFFLIALLTTHERRKWFSYSLITTVSSVLGGVFAYAIGFLFFKTLGGSISHFYNLDTRIDSMQAVFAANALGAILFAAFMPIPEAYKVGALAAGVFHLPLPVFILASLIGRGARFFLVGICMRIAGEWLTEFVYKHFTLVVYCMIALLVALIALVA